MKYATTPFTKKIIYKQSSSEAIYLQSFNFPHMDLHTTGVSNIVSDLSDQNLTLCTEYVRVN